MHCILKEKNSKAGLYICASFWVECKESPLSPFITLPIFTKTRPKLVSGVGLPTSCTLNHGKKSAKLALSSRDNGKDHYSMGGYGIVSSKPFTPDCAYLHNHLYRVSVA